MAVLKFPPVLFFRASNPTAMFCCPYVLEYSEFFPIAVFLKPEELISILEKNDLRLDKVDGMNFNLIKNKWSVSNDKSVNYIAKFIKN